MPLPREYLCVVLNRPIDSSCVSFACACTAGVSDNANIAYDNKYFTFFWNII